MAHEQWQYLRNRFSEATVPYKTVCAATEVAHEHGEVKKESGQPEVDRGASKRKCQQWCHAEAHCAATSHPQKSVSAHSTSHNNSLMTLIPGPTNTTSNTNSPVAVNKGEWTSENHLPNTPIEYARLPDEVDDEAKWKSEMVVAEVSRELAKVEVVVEANGNNEHWPDEPTTAPDSAEESTWQLDMTQNKAHRPDGIEVKLDGGTKPSWNESAMHRRTGTGDIREGRWQCQSIDIEGESGCNSQYKVDRVSTIECTWPTVTDEETDQLNVLLVMGNGATRSSKEATSATTWNKSKQVH